jgi:hypothetical protein
MEKQPQYPPQTRSSPYHTSGGATLYLCACPIYYLRYGDLRAYDQLVSAAPSTDPGIRAIAEKFLAACITQNEVCPERGSGEARTRILSCARATSPCPAQYGIDTPAFQGSAGPSRR